jgi:hypothetical protein
MAVAAEEPSAAVAAEEPSAVVAREGTARLAAVTAAIVMAVMAVVMVMAVMDTAVGVGAVGASAWVIGQGITDTGMATIPTILATVIRLTRLILTHTMPHPTDIRLQTDIRRLTDIPPHTDIRRLTDTIRMLTFTRDQVLE